MQTTQTVRHDWTLAEIQALYDLPFSELMFQAQTIHRQYFNPNQVQVSTLLSIKTGACPEDCKYCSQSGHFDTGLEKQKLMDIDTILKSAKKAKENGATRFCMGAGWRTPPKKNMPELVDIIEQVKALGLETCLTAGMLNEHQAGELKSAGLDYYNHNLDTSREHYAKIVTTRCYDDRLNTLKQVRDAGINVCCGGILGLGETLEDRLKLLQELANLSEHPESVPINKLIPIPGTPLENTAPIDNFEFIRVIAIARMMMPKSKVRLSAGRNEMSEEVQAFCFLAGANSIHYGEKLLTTDLPETQADLALFKKLGLQIEQANEISKTPA